MTTSRVLSVMACIFLLMVMAFLLNLWGRTAPLPPVPPVDPAFLSTHTVRQSAAELIARDPEAFNCNLCHSEIKPRKPIDDLDSNFVFPEAHSDIEMNHGSHQRNNRCYNCHDPIDRNLLRRSDGHKVPFSEVTQLCASCHGPTYRDWEAGSHGRISGYWDRKKGEPVRQPCDACHNPHQPQFGTLKPAPGPHMLHPPAESTHDLPAKDH